MFDVTCEIAEFVGTYGIVPDGRCQPVDEPGNSRHQLNLLLLSHSLADKIRQKTVVNFTNILQAALRQFPCAKNVQA